MSILGTSVAAGVAQAALNAQQLARRQDRVRNEQDNLRKQWRELVEIHVQAIEEGDESDSPTRVHIDDLVPEHPQQRAAEQLAEQPEGDESQNDQPPRPSIDVTA